MQHRRQQPVSFEALEQRALFSTVFMVTTTADSGTGSLRQAILDANNSPGLNEIHFNIAAGGAQTITPQTQLPDLNDAVVIDGTTQPGYAGKPIVEINGAQTNNADGLRIYFGSGSTLKGLVINRFDGWGIRDVSTGNNTIQNCYIGTNVAGNADLGNGTGGVSLFSRNNLVGGTLPQHRNVVSGNGNGNSTFIGPGISLLSAGGGNRVQGNYIGVAADGKTPLGNSAVGIDVSDFGGLIGGTEGGAGNLIAFNGSAGISINPSAKDYAILGNSIYANAGLGIDLRGPQSALPDGPTPNDLLDADNGGNRLQNAPVLESALTHGGKTVLTGKLHSEKNKQYRVEIFRNASTDQSPQGKTFVTAFEVTTDGFGNAKFKLDLPAAISPGVLLTATATDPDNNTSEFSLARKVTAKPVRGSIFNDLDGDGVRDAGEPALANRRVYVDSNNNGRFDKGEPSRLTDSKGNYVFDDVMGSNLKLRQVVPAGWRQTVPAAAFYSGDLTIGSNDFACTTSAIVRGSVFYDANRNGLKDANESGLAGWTVFLDKNNNGTLDANEKVRVTNSRGEYRFAGLTAGTYTIRVVSQGQFQMTAPANGFFRAKLAEGQSLSNRNFGEWRDQEIPA